MLRLNSNQFVCSISLSLVAALSEEKTIEINSQVLKLPSIFVVFVHTSTFCSSSDTDFCITAEIERIQNMLQGYLLRNHFVLLHLLTKLIKDLLVETKFAVFVKKFSSAEEKILKVTADNTIAT